ncbi:hypothetical protein [Nonomuraea candida]|uniref:hypothetical protein n=1 Tax=Nonomuraea candida TaxID=359159 RepID=UPI0012FBDE30|nr:hypothetical protein [Nonomuraea candida]
MTDVLLRGGLPRGPGAPADLMVRDGRIAQASPAEAVVVHPARTLVMKDGVVLHN